MASSLVPGLPFEGYHASEFAGEINTKWKEQKRCRASLLLIFLSPTSGGFPFRSNGFRGMQFRIFPKNFVDLQKNIGRIAARDN
jgi:hypothetical protein